MPSRLLQRQERQYGVRNMRKQANWTYKVSLKRVPQDKAWLCLVVESPSGYVVAAYETKGLVKAIKFWSMSRAYWRQVSKELK